MMIYNDILYRKLPFLVSKITPIPEEAAKKDSTISLFLVKQGGTSVNSGSVSPSSLGTCIRYWRSA